MQHLDRACAWDAHRRQGAPESRLEHGAGRQNRVQPRYQGRSQRDPRGGGGTCLCVHDRDCHGLAPPLLVAHPETPSGPFQRPLPLHGRHGRCDAHGEVCPRTPRGRGGGQCRIDPFRWASRCRRVSSRPMRSRRPPSPRQRCVPDVPQRPGQPGRCCDRVAARRDSSARERGRSDGLLASWLTLPRVAGGVAGHRHPQVASRLAPLGDHRLVVAPAVAARGATHAHTLSLSAAGPAADCPRALAGLGRVQSTHAAAHSPMRAVIVPFTLVCLPSAPHCPPGCAHVPDVCR
jgi:hypothetical protein